MPGFILMILMVAIVFVWGCACLEFFNKKKYHPSPEYEYALEHVSNKPQKNDIILVKDE